ncbi:MAG TPA: GatB/YqeY domain-containing protein [Bdellovibrionota bacterium]|nr:GatB/YqeY domain-containing protein [Bdellovibrionota bacterium]
MSQTPSGLKGDIDRALIDAQKAKDALKTSTLRMLRSALKYKEIEKKQKSLTDEEIIQVIGVEIKKRREAIELYQKGGRPELAEKEGKEAEILSLFLPEQLPEAELEKLVEKVIKTVGATTVKDMGAVMKGVMELAKGRADGKLINQLVRKKLEI